jgi:hypothetical protein
MKALVWLALVVCCVATHAASGGATAPAVTPNASAPPAPTERRVALVIGNSAYRQSPLVNPVNDARAMAQVLTAAGFQVIRKENAGLEDMQTALRDFGDTLKSGGVGLFYYAGHAVQVKGRNYLIPVDARIEREDEMAYRGVDANQVLDKMESAGNRLNIVILDACRNNPFVRGFRSTGGGLAQMDAPVGTLVAFSTAPGSVASDGQGENGLYTGHLLEAIKVPGTKIEDVFKRVRTKVREDTDGKQIPWENTSLEGDFVFVPLPPKPAAPAKRQATSAPAAIIEEIAAPDLKVGDRWEHQTIDMFSGSVVRRYTLNLKEITADEWRFDASATDKSWNLLRVFRDDKVTTKWSPKRPTYDFPLRPGKTWSARGVLKRDGLVSENLVDFKVVRQERVLVPAGVFDTLRVEGTGKYKSTHEDGKTGEGTLRHRYWFSPEAGAFVAYEYEETNSKGVRSRSERDELVSYRRSR